MVLPGACASDASRPISVNDPWIAPEPAPSMPIHAADWIIQSPAGVERPPFHFSSQDDALLNEIQRASFWFLWCAADPATGMVVDRSSVKFASIAGVGFQLAALPVAVERAWITRDQGRQRAELILRSLENEPTNRKAGLFYHFLDGVTAKPIDNDVVSTIDSAIFFSGAIVAGQYFGGDVRAISDRLVRAADWQFFVENTPRAHEPHMKGFISLGWKAANFADPTGDGRTLPYYWRDSGDEHRLVTFLAVAAPEETHRVAPATYYQLRRQLGEYKDSGPMVWFPWSGALFVNVFAHIFIDYAARDADQPAALAVHNRPRVDWWENSRRAMRMHRIKCIENPKNLPTLGEHSWGLTACDAATGYSVPGVFPNLIKTQDMRPDLDYVAFDVKDNFADGTIAPYGAGCAIMFDPASSIAALRHYRSLKSASGDPLVWREPAPDPCSIPNFGFQDSFNLATAWVAPDCVSIDQGPLVLSIENARSGLIWHLFEAHPWVQAGMERLKIPPPAR